METRAKLRFGVMCRDSRLPTWEAETIRQLLQSGLAEPVVLVLEGPRDDPEDLQEDGQEPPPSRPTAETALYRWYDQLWVRRRSRALKPAERPAWLDDVEEVLGPPLGEALKPLRLDFILRFGSGPLPDELLGAARFGVWSFNRTSEPDSPACFWEVARGEAKTEVTLARLTDSEGSAVVLHRGFFGTCKGSWVNNLDRALLGAAGFCSRVCAEILAGGSADVGREPTAAFWRASRIPGTVDLLRFFTRTAGHVVAKAWELLFHLEVWNVGFSPDSVEEIVRQGQVDPARITWCAPHRPGFFIADPFGYSRDGQEHILVEEYDQSARGWISRLSRPQPGQPLELAPEIEEPFHMSYPCVFSEDGQDYCVPETYQANGAGLYRRADGGWRRVRNIVEGAPIVDPTLFRHGEHYWLLCTHQNDGAWGNLKLHGYYADRLDAVFKPHPLNPLKCDIGSSRPAGRVLVMDGAIYRPSQDCSSTYGGAVVINQIVRLTPTEFAETVVTTLRPFDQGPYPHGLHTLNRVSDGAVIDGKKFTFDLRGMVINWSRLHEVFQ